MTTGGIILLAAAWGIILTLVGFSFGRILRDK
jgi:hypothetical protein